MKEFISVQEAIQITGRSLRTIYKWIDQGILEAEQPMRGKRGKRGSAYMIRYLSIPSYLRR